MKRFFLCSLFLVLAGCQSSPKEPVEVPLLEEASMRITSEDYSFVEVKKENSSLLNVYDDIHYEFDVKKGRKEAGSLHVKVRTIDNSDQLVFLQLEGELEKKEVPIQIHVPFHHMNDYEFTTWDAFEFERTHDGNTGMDRTTQPIGLFELSGEGEGALQLVLSKQYTSIPLQKEYDNGLKSDVRELHDEFAEYDLKTEDEQLTLSFPLTASKGELAEGWFMLANEELFAEPKHHESWIHYQIKQYKEANGWLTIGGPLKKLPWSIEPYTQEGYGRNLGVMVDREAIDRYFTEKERYFYNLSVNSVADLYEYRKEKDTSIWETEYTSTWLQKAYGLNAPYIDTRHNEFIALYLHKMGEELQIQELTDAQLHYGDYLIEQIAIENVIHAGDGLFISDYFSPYDPSQKTHASLNHILGGANLLLECYEQTKDEKYLQAAKQIRTAIEYIGEDWIRETGDLWYQVNPDLTFAGNDYEQLTLVDLLNHQAKWESIGETRSALIDVLIKSKLEYLKSENIQLLDKVTIQLEAQGLEELL